MASVYSIGVQRLLGDGGDRGQDVAGQTHDDDRQRQPALPHAQAQNPDGSDESCPHKAHKPDLMKDRG